MLDRILGVFRLNPQTFEDIEADTGATGQAALVVLVAGLTSAVGGALGATVVDGAVTESFIVGLVSAFTGWILWSALTLYIGTRLFDGRADMGEMLRVIGFAYAPQVLAIIPCLGWVVGMVWSLIAGFVAVRQGLDLDNAKAFLTILIGFLAYVAISAVLNLFVGGASQLI